LFLNGSSSIEPRASVRWQVNNRNSVAFGFGAHSQLQALGVYFAKPDNGNGAYLPNKDLEFTKAKHYVLSFQHSFNRFLMLKAEAYYQQLYNVPVSIYDSSTVSTLNIEQDYISDPLINKGEGRNYGIELSLEKYLSNSFYYTVSTSLYESRYTAADGIERDTRFNGNYMGSLVAGKEFVTSDKRRTLGLNFKVIYAGGLRYTPIDEERSIQQGYPFYMEKQAFTLKNPDYFRTDLRLSMKWNRKNFTSTLSLDIQNVTNRLNVYTQWFDTETNKLVTAYQVGLIPILNYKIEF
jgi:TonB dependent receptor